MNAWNTVLVSFLGFRPIFRGELLLVLGRFFILKKWWDEFSHQNNQLLQLLWQPTQAGTSCAIWFEALLSVGPSTATIGPAELFTKSWGAGGWHLTSPKRTNWAKKNTCKGSKCRSDHPASRREGLILDRLHLTTLKGLGSWNLI